MILPISGLRADLAEIDENLIRNELTPLERGEQLAKRKEIYEAIYPETRPTKIRGGHGRGCEKTTAELAVVSFAEDTAAKTGSSVRTIQREIQIAKGITDPVKEMIRGTLVAEDQSALLTIAQKPPSEQPSAARRAPRSPGSISLLRCA
jgi:ParB family transcriptional regulator, chromosome partitioning protein